jgi:DNA-directed RNA polymerase specialized sigma24 family protein
MLSDELALDQLPEAHAAVLRLRDLGLSERTIAERLGLEPEAVGPLLRLAEAKRAALLASARERPGD